MTTCGLALEAEQHGFFEPLSRIAMFPVDVGFTNAPPFLTACPHETHTCLDFPKLSCSPNAHSKAHTKDLSWLPFATLVQAAFLNRFTKSGAHEAEVVHPGKAVNHVPIPIYHSGRRAQIPHV